MDKVHSNIQFLLGEGVVTAYAGQARDMAKEDINTFASMFKSGESKIAHVREVCSELVAWLKKEEADNKDLQFEMNGFKKWAKTSHYFNVYYIFMLSDVHYNQLMADTKGSEASQKNFQSVGDTFKERYKKADASVDAAIGEFDGVKKIADLISIVEKFEKRANDYAKALKAAAENPKVGKMMYLGGYQLMVSAVGSLNTTVKKIVNLAE